jgi:hypothetical protein
MKALRTFFLLSLLPGLVVAQQPAPASLHGIVVLAGTNTPLADVRVDLRAVGGAATSDGLGPPFVTTGPDGRFTFPRLTPSRYRLVATRRGFAAAEYGQTQPGGPTSELTLRAGQRLDNVRLTMARGAVIGGRITDNGQPVGIADVYALKVTDYNGRVSLVGSISAKTNDLGEYRIFWLPPGRYWVGVIIPDAADAGALIVNPNGDNSMSLQVTRQVQRAVLNRAVGAGAADDQRHVMTFYPGTIDPDRAIPLELQAGAEATNINIEAPVQRMYHVRGRVSGMPEGVTTAPAIGLLTNRPNDILENLSAPVDIKTGNFDIPRVLPGSYTLTAASGNVMGRFAVEVRDGDVNNIVVNMTRGIEANGKITVEPSTSARPDSIAAGLRVILQPDPLIWDPYGSTVKPDGTFQIPANPTAPGVQAGTYRVLVAPIHIARTIPGEALAPIPDTLKNAYVKSIKMGGQDLLTSILKVDSALPDPIEVIVGTNPGSIDGRVMTEGRQPAVSVWVALVPENGLRFRTDHKYISTDANGAFQLPYVPPGDYKIYAWEKIEKFDWQEPRVMRTYETRGTPVHIEEGRKVTVELTAIPSPN